eukprot:GHVS01001286.1.p1 GENE.GHVS01001286.1~~GHVS01001286.1.p1  ORF type:complete len:449 (-),score=45.27 GHVS01001286.1:168-1514(-)
MAEIEEARSEQLEAREMLKVLLNVVEPNTLATPLADSTKDTSTTQESQALTEPTLLTLIEGIIRSCSTCQSDVHPQSCTAVSAWSDIRKNDESATLLDQLIVYLKERISQVDKWKRVTSQVGGRVRNDFARVLMFAWMAHNNIKPTPSSMDIGPLLAQSVALWLMARGVTDCQCDIVGSSANDLFVRGVSDLDMACNTTQWTVAAEHMKKLKLEDLKCPHQLTAVEYIDEKVLPSIVTVKLNITTVDSDASVDVVFFDSSDGEYKGVIQTDLVRSILLKEGPNGNESIRSVLPVLKCVAHLVRQSLDQEKSFGKSMSSFGLVILLKSMTNLMSTEGKLVTSRSLLRFVVQRISQLGSKPEENRMNVSFKDDTAVLEYSAMVANEDQHIGITVHDPSEQKEYQISHGTIEEGVFSGRQGVKLYNTAAECPYQQFKLYQAIMELIEAWLL